MLKNIIKIVKKSNLSSCNDSEKMRQPDKIKLFLKTYFKIEGAYTISDDGVVDINGNISLQYEKFNQDGFTELPIQFGHVKGYFSFAYAKNITTMKGFPHTVDSYCSINNNEQLTSLEFSPQCFRFYSHNCKKLESLNGLNCVVFIAENLHHSLKEFGTNLKVEHFEFNYFPEPTADEMRNFINLKIIMETCSNAPWIQLLEDYSEHKDMFRAISEFEKLYNEPWVKPENRIEILNSDLTIDL